MELHTIGLDLGKTIFHLVGLNLRGEVVVRKKFSRKQLRHFKAATLQVELIDMEACGGARFLGRALRKQGHEVRLMPAQCVKPYVKTNKSDYIDAEAIAEAVGRPKMSSVTINSGIHLTLGCSLRKRSAKISGGGDYVVSSLCCRYATKATKKFDSLAVSLCRMRPIWDGQIANVG